MQENVPVRRKATEIADEILEFLRTGEPHGTKEIAEAVRLSEEEAERILDSLARMGFVKKNAEITDSGLDFLVRFLERMGLVKKSVRITTMGLDFLRLPGEEEEQESPPESR